PHNTVLSCLLVSVAGRYVIWPRMGLTGRYAVCVNRCASLALAPLNVGADKLIRFSSSYIDQRFSCCCNEIAAVWQMTRILGCWTSVLHNRCGLIQPADGKKSPG